MVSALNIFSGIHLVSLSYIGVGRASSRGRLINRSRFCSFFSISLLHCLFLTSFSIDESFSKTLPTYLSVISLAFVFYKGMFGLNIVKHIRKCLFLPYLVFYQFVTHRRFMHSKAHMFISKMAFRLCCSGS